MWERLNRDIPIYRISAAKIFAYMLGKNRNEVAPLSRSPTSVSPLEIAFALDIENSLDVLKGNTVLKEMDIVKLCAKGSRDIRLRCAGLLEVRCVKSEEAKSSRNAGWDPVQVPQQELDYSHPKQMVVFIHRTAYHYLLTTEHGMSLTSNHGWTRDEQCLKTACAILASRQCRAPLTNNIWTSFYRECPRSSADTHRHPWLGFLAEAAGDQDQLVAKSAGQILLLCLQLFSSSAGYHSGCARAPEFKPLASSCLRYPGLAERVLENVEPSTLPLVILCALGNPLTLLNAGLDRMEPVSRPVTTIINI